MRLFLILALLLSMPLARAQAAFSLKELVTIKGVQENELSGTGLVYGLAGTGDKKNPEKDRMIAAVLQNADLQLTGQPFDTKNTALVQVTGRLPAFAGKGQQVQLQVSAIGDAKSLRKGILHFTMLSYPIPGDDKRGDGKKVIMVTAEGPLEFPPNYAETSGIVRGIVQTEVPVSFVRDGVVQLLLRRPDFVDADRIARQVNQYFMRTTGKDIAVAVSAGQVNVSLPEQFADNPVAFVAQLEKIPVLLTDVSAKVRVNSKTGSIMFNDRVEVAPFAFSYKDLTVVVDGQPKAAPTIDSQRVILVDPKTDGGKTSLQALVDALNAFRVSPEDLVEIVKEAHKLGAIQAELIVE